MTLRVTAGRNRDLFHAMAEVLDTPKRRPKGNGINLEEEGRDMFKCARREGHTNIVVDIPARSVRPLALKRKSAVESEDTFTHNPRKRIRVKTAMPNCHVP